MNLLGFGLSESGFNPRKLRPSLYLSADRGVYQDAAVQFKRAHNSGLAILDANQTGLNLGTDDGIICGWFWFDSLPFVSFLIEKGGLYSSDAPGYCLRAQSSASLMLCFGDARDHRTYRTSTAGVVKTGKWHFISIVFDRSSNAVVAVDGKTVITMDVSALGGNAQSTRALTVGAQYLEQANYFDGRIDSLMFFKMPDLSGVADDIIAWAYNGGSGRLCAEITAEQKAAWGAVSGWEFAEQSGTRADSWGDNDLSEQLGEGVTEIACAPGIVRSIATNGDGVSYWQDQSTGGKHATQITLAKRPTLVTAGINSRPVIRGDGVDDYLGVPELSLEGAFCISAVFQLGEELSEWENHCKLCGSVGGFGKVNTYIDFYHLYDEDTVSVRCDNSPTGSFSLLPLGTDRHILTVTRDASDAVRVFLDGVESSTGPLVLTGPFNIVQILNYEGNYFPGDIAEFLVYDGEKSAAELARLLPHLARRYGITI